MSINIKKVENKKELQNFIDFPHDLFKGDKNYVPMLQMAAKEILSEKKNPFFEHSQVQNFLAYKNGKIAGRISAIRNNNYNDYHKSNVGFWGFYDVIDDYEVSKALFDKVVEWHKENKFDSIIGPTNFSTNDTAGLLIEGFDRPPIVEMTYNKPYYQDHIEKYGFTKDMDLYAYMIYAKNVSDKSVRLAKMIKQRLKKKGITIRTVNMKDFKNEVSRIKKVYNKAWENNWGFVPATDKEFDFLAEGLKMLGSIMEMKNDASAGGISKLAFNDAVERLECLKQRGVFDAFEQVLGMTERVGAKMQKVDFQAVEPIRGIFGMMAAMKRPEVQEGLGVLIELSTVMTALKSDPTEAIACKSGQAA